MESERFLRFILLVDGIHKSVQKIKNKLATEFGVKGVHTLWMYELFCHPEGMTASELAAKSMIDRSLISREIEHLKSMGYITAEEVAGKRNYNSKIRLTEKGTEVARRIGDIAIDVQSNADIGIDSEELARFYVTLEKLSGNLSGIADEKENN